MRPKPRARIPGTTARPSRTGLFTKNSSWSRRSLQSTSVRAASGCGPVAEHQHVDRPQPIGDRGDELGDLRLVGDVGGKRAGHAAAVADAADDFERHPPSVAVVDRDGQAVAREPPRYRARGAAGAAGAEPRARLGGHPAPVSPGAPVPLRGVTPPAVVQRLALPAMKQSISLITLGVADPARARAFYAAIGWSPAMDV